MGDRIVVGFVMDEDAKNTLFLYLHSGGYQMMHNLAVGLNRAVSAGLLNDYCYGSRIVCSDLIDPGSDLGAGFMVNEIPVDIQHKIPMVNFFDNTVSLYDPFGKPGNVWDVWEYPDRDKWTKLFTMDIENFVTKFRKASRSQWDEYNYV